MDEDNMKYSDHIRKMFLNFDNNPERNKKLSLFFNLFFLLVLLIIKILTLILCYSFYPNFNYYIMSYTYFCLGVVNFLIIVLSYQTKPFLTFYFKLIMVYYQYFIEVYYMIFLASSVDYLNINYLTRYINSFFICSIIFAVFYLDFNILINIISLIITTITLVIIDNNNSLNFKFYYEIVFNIAIHLLIILVKIEYSIHFYNKIFNLDKVTSKNNILESHCNKGNNIYLSLFDDNNVFVNQGLYKVLEEYAHYDSLIFKEKKKYIIDQLNEDEKFKIVDKNLIDGLIFMSLLSLNGSIVNEKVKLIIEEECLRKPISLFDIFKIIKKNTFIDNNPNIIYNLGIFEIIKIPELISPNKENIHSRAKVAFINQKNNNKNTLIKSYFYVNFNVNKIDNSIEFQIHDISHLKNIKIENSGWGINLLSEESNDSFKQRLLSKIAHEFKTPLISILSMIKNLNFAEKKKIKKLMKEIDNLLYYVIFLVNDIVESINSKLISLKIETFDLNKFIKFNFKTLKTLIMYHGKKGKIIPNFEFDSKLQGISISNDKNRLLQIVMNLISNSVKFTNSGKINIIVNKIDEGAQFIIEDTGIGMSEEEIKKFNDTSEDNEKIKLGLNVAQKIALRLETKLIASSSKGVWSRISFEIKNLSQDSQIQEDDQDEEFRQRKPSTYIHKSRIILQNRKFTESKDSSKDSISLDESFHSDQNSKDKSVSDENDSRSEKIRKKTRNISKFSIIRLDGGAIESNYDKTSEKTLKNNCNFDCYEIKQRLLKQKSNPDGDKAAKKKFNSSKYIDILENERLDTQLFQLSDRSIKYFHQSNSKKKSLFSKKVININTNNLINISSFDRAVIKRKSFEGTGISIKRSNMSKKSILQTSNTNNNRNSISGYLQNNNILEVRVRYSIIIIDDYRACRVMLENCLKLLLFPKYENCIEIINCVDGVDLLYHFVSSDQTKILCCFVDENMMYMNGSEAAKFIRKWEDEFHIINRLKLFSITANNDNLTSLNIFNAGFDYLITKPAKKIDLDNLFKEFKIYDYLDQINL